jgi:hypothetical protein
LVSPKAPKFKRNTIRDGKVALKSTQAVFFVGAGTPCVGIIFPQTSSSPTPQESSTKHRQNGSPSCSLLPLLQEQGTSLKFHKFDEQMSENILSWGKIYGVTQEVDYKLPEMKHSGWIRSVTTLSSLSQSSWSIYRHDLFFMMI